MTIERRTERQYGVPLKNELRQADAADERLHRERFEGLMTRLFAGADRVGIGNAFKSGILSKFHREFNTYEERADSMERVIAVHNKLYAVKDTERLNGSAYLVALDKNPAIADLCSKGFHDYVIKASDAVLEELIFAVQQPSNAVLASDRILGFAGLLGENAFGYFKAAHESGEVGNLADGRVLNERIAAFVNGISVSGHYAFHFFNAIHGTSNLDLLTSDEVLRFAKSIGPVQSARFFAYITNSQDLEVQYFEYYKALFETRKDDSLDLFSMMQFSLSPTFTIAAWGNMGSGSVDIERHTIANCIDLPASFEHAGRLERAAVLLEKIFSSESFANKALDQVFTTAEIKGHEALTREEKLRLAAHGITWLKDNRESIQRFVERRGSGETMDPQMKATLAVIGFDTDRIDGTRIIGRMELKGEREIDSYYLIMPYIALSMLVLGLNGSRNNKLEESHRKMLKKLLGDDAVERAVASWYKIRMKHIREMGDAYNSSDLDAVANIFRRASKSLSPRDRANVMDVVLPICRATSGENMKQLVAYTVKGKNDAIMTSGKQTACCAFISDPGNKSSSSVEYANSPGIVLINFSVVDERQEQDPEKLRAHGVAICALGTSDRRPVLYIDSIEGGIRFANAVEGREQELFRIISAYAKEIGAEATFLSTKGSTSDIPMRFMQAKPEDQHEKVQMALLTSNQLLEGMPHRSLPYVAPGLQVLRL